MAKVKRNVVFVLGNQNYVPPERVSDACFIEDIGISTRAVAHDNPRTVDQSNHILNNGGVFPNIVGAPAAEASVLGSSPYAGITELKPASNGIIADARAGSMLSCSGI